MRREYGQPGNKPRGCERVHLGVPDMEISAGMAIFAVGIGALIQGVGLVLVLGRIADALEILAEQREERDAK